MKKFIIALLTMILAFGLFSCGNSSSDTAEEPATPPDLTGEWVQTNSQSDTDYMKATITEDAIEINWVFESEDMVSLYWAGTFIAPTEPGDEYSWTSENDTEQTDTALLASSDATKDFTYNDGVLSFEASAMGTTSTIKMEQQNE